MFAALKQVAAVGATVAGVGWVAVLSPAVSHTQPPRTLAGNNVTCPDGAAEEVQYVRDPDDSNAYYVCEGGLPQQHLRCPAVAKLVMSAPPKCSPLGNHHATP